LRSLKGAREVEEKEGEREGPEKLRRRSEKGVYTNSPLGTLKQYM